MTFLEFDLHGSSSKGQVDQNFVDSMCFHERPTSPEKVVGKVDVIAEFVVAHNPKRQSVAAGFCSVAPERTRSVGEGEAAVGWDREHRCPVVPMTGDCGYHGSAPVAGDGIEGPGER
jgi:hypothetical protein